MSNVTFAFTLSLLAGLSTGIGSAVAFFAKKNNTAFLSVSLGLSAGVMIYVSMMELMPNAISSLSESLTEKNASIIAMIAFFGGMLLIYLIQRFIPEDGVSRKKPKKSGDVSEKPDSGKSKLLRAGMVTALAIGIHNFPEGLATFMSALKDPSVALPIFVAIAIHNIPEGISVSMPIYYATGNKKRAFLVSFLSGITEPVGALLGYLLLMPIMKDAYYGIIFAVISGVMVFISFDEILPAAEEYGSHRLSLAGTIIGMAVMAISLVLFM
ncbi:MAG: zinc transporter ZupT [Oscillospiraceae bacterium]|jgi:ZIP family zinc transporter|nr:zinc transporter ZupT [Oscillospiraceae bacterium]